MNEAALVFCLAVHLSFASQELYLTAELLIAFHSSHYNEHAPVSYLHQCFYVDQKLGEGSFGVVYKVRCLDDGRWYAVKVANREFRGQRDRWRQLQEVAKHELLPPHPHCVRFIKAWEEDYRLYIQTELCECSLATYTEKHHNLSEQLVWEFLVDLLLGVKHLHDHDLAHMDIKPENIFISKDGYYKLGDFGLVLDLKRVRLSPQLHSVIQQMMHPDPQQRITADQLLALPDVRQVRLRRKLYVARRRAPPGGFHSPASSHSLHPPVPSVAGRTSYLDSDCFSDDETFGESLNHDLGEHQDFLGVNLSSFERSFCDGGHLLERSTPKPLRHRHDQRLHSTPTALFSRRSRSNSTPPPVPFNLSMDDGTIENPFSAVWLVRFTVHQSSRIITKASTIRSISHAWVKSVRPPQRPSNRVAASSVTISCSRQRLAHLAWPASANLPLSEFTVAVMRWL
ncbi:hypothetical protein HPB49_011187 [Dermacentor silvarum]|uniref:Uncharacterized protein n=1 Tax=Dermacentor silvarum TaxID=543639 RepID=A0ACB8DZI8_DERSI|nr:hypothetical protein HPB49_011187 [Dermacentor silvarum]